MFVFLILEIVKFVDVLLLVLVKFRLKFIYELKKINVINN